MLLLLLLLLYLICVGMISCLKLLVGEYREVTQVWHQDDHRICEDIPASHVPNAVSPDFALGWG